MYIMLNKKVYICCLYFLKHILVKLLSSSVWYSGFNVDEHDFMQSITNKYLHLEEGSNTWT